MLFARGGRSYQDSISHNRLGVCCLPRGSSDREKLPQATHREQSPKSATGTTGSTQPVRTLAKVPEDGFGREGLERTPAMESEKEGLVAG